jgi:hypothetical protein
MVKLVHSGTHSAVRRLKRLATVEASSERRIMRPAPRGRANRYDPRREQTRQAIRTTRKGSRKGNRGRPCVSVRYLFSRVRGPSGGVRFGDGFPRG